MNNRLSRFRIVLLFVVPVAISSMTVATFQTGAPTLAILLSVAISALAWYSFMNIPYEYEYDDTGEIVFRSFARQTMITMRNITDIDARRWNKGFIKIRSPQGSVSMSRETPGIRQLIETVKSKNSTVRIRGNY